MNDAVSEMLKSYDAEGLYDYLFYLSRGTPVSTEHLKARLVQSGIWKGEEPFTAGDAKRLLCDCFDSIDYRQGREDVRPLIRDQMSLEVWSAGFFKQITEGLKQE